MLAQILKNMNRGNLTLIIILIAFIKLNAQSILNEVMYPEVKLKDTEVRELNSHFNGQTYKIYIDFPRGYQNSNNTYPVLYVLDAEIDFGGVTFIADRLIKDKIIPEMLIVGIAYDTDLDNFYSLRCRDLTPTKSIEYDCPGSGGAESFRKFLEKELFPFIQLNYNIDTTDRALFGYSFGGLFGAYTLFKEPRMFNRYLLLSPSLWWNNKIVFTYIPDRIEFPIDLYMTTGELENVKEHYGQSMVDHQNELEKILKTEKYNNLNMKFEIQENETHRTIFGTGFTKGLRFIYSDFNEKK
jgi:uncharacterized protein